MKMERPCQNMREQRPRPSRASRRTLTPSFRIVLAFFDELRDKFSRKFLLAVVNYVGPNVIRAGFEP